MPAKAGAAELCPLDPNQPIYTLTVAQLLAQLERIAERDPSPAESPPLLVTGSRLAELCSVSRATVHRWRQRGMPAIQVGDEYRYEPAACLAWLRAGGAAQ